VENNHPNEPNGSYFRVSHKVFESIQFQELNNDGKLFYFYLCRYRNKFRHKISKDGFFSYSDRQALKELRWGSVKLKKVSGKVLEAGLITMVRKPRAIARYQVLK